MKKVIIILSLLILTIALGFYAKQKFYDPRHKISNAKAEARQLAGEIQNGDLSLLVGVFTYQPCVACSVGEDTHR